MLATPAPPVYVPPVLPQPAFPLQEGSVAPVEEVDDAAEDMVDEERNHERKESKKEVIDDLINAEEDIDVALSAFLLLGFSVSIGLLYIVNFRDADIRSFAYKMINTTVTILCAVVFVKATKRSWTYAVNTPEDVKEPKMVYEVSFGLLMVLVSLFMLNGSCYYFRKYPIWIYSCKSLFGHIFAFSAIAAFGPLMESFTSTIDCISLLLCLVAAQIFFSSGTIVLRRRFDRNRSRGDAQEVVMTEEGEAFWEEATKESEDEASALMLSLMFNIIICLSLTGKRIPYEPESDEVLAYTEQGIQGIIYWFLAFVVGLLLATFSRAVVKATGPAERVLQAFHNFLSMSTGWCMLRLGLLYSIRRFPKHPMMAFLANGLGMSIVCSMSLIMIDAVADHLLAQDHKGGEHATLEDSTPDEEPQANFGDLSPQSIARRSNRIMRKLRIVMSSPRHKEKALRNIMDALGLAIGLSWEMILDISADNLSKGARDMTLDDDGETHFFVPHGVFKGVLCSMSLLVFVIPAWMRFIVPKSMMHEHEHQQQIDQEIEREKGQPHFLRERVESLAEFCGPASPPSEDNSSSEME